MNNNDTYAGRRGRSYQAPALSTHNRHLVLSFRSSPLFHFLVFTSTHFVPLSCNKSQRVGSRKWTGHVTVQATPKFSLPATLLASTPFSSPTRSSMTSVCIQSSPKLALANSHRPVSLGTVSEVSDLLSPSFNFTGHHCVTVQLLQARARIYREAMTTYGAPNHGRCTESRRPSSSRCPGRPRWLSALLIRDQERDS